jgi:hypothetical protein
MEMIPDMVNQNIQEALKKRRHIQEDTETNK